MTQPHHSRPLGLRIGFCLLPLLILAVPVQSQAPAEGAKPGPPGSDAVPYLTELFSRYGHASTFHLESRRERLDTGAHERNWSESSYVAILAPGHRYRFERRGTMGDAMQVSDGETEWVYSPGLNQYTQQPTPGGGPSQIHTGASMGVQSLREAQNAAQSVAHYGPLIHTAKFAADQEVEIEGEKIGCIVVTTEGRPPGWEGVTTAFTFWIDKRSGLIRKLTHHAEGTLRSMDPSGRYVDDETEVFAIAEFDVSDFPEGTFTFAAPANSVLVRQFETKQDQELAKFVGSRLPEVTLKSAEGAEVSLQTIQGRPLLLDFWATWCEPCRESLPRLEELYQEYKDEGVVLLSLDEDEEAAKASDFWAKHKMPWQNYHLGREAIAKFPPHGIPYFLLIDAKGKVVYSHAGLDKEMLRAALASLHSPPASSH